jgi:MFS family permease
VSDREPLPPDFRWNFGAFVADYASFLIGFNFISVASVLPAFVRQLTDSAPLIGLASTIFNAGWTLPQLAAARVLENRPRKKGFLRAAMIWRISIPLIAVALWSGLASRPTAMLTLFFACMAVFALSDGFVTLAWFEILARTIPERRRGRLIGLSQFIGGAAGIGVGVIVGRILQTRSFPENYALLFTCASLGMAVSAVALLLLREPAPEVRPSDDRVPSRSWLAVLAGDRDFRRLIACRMLVGMTSLATPFYVNHAADVMNLPERVIGGFVVASTAGSLASSIILGLGSERLGTRRIIHITSVVSIIGPIFVLAVDVLRVGWLTNAYPVAFVTLGVSTSSWMLGFTNYMLEIAPERIRPAYVGLGNTLMGLMAFVPMFGGWLLQVSSFRVLFGLAGLLCALGAALTFTLRSAYAANPDRVCRSVESPAAPATCE